MYFRQHFCLTTLIFPERQSSTATTGSTGTQRSCVTVNTTLSTIPEDINQIQTERKPEHKNIYRDKNKQWVFQGKVQGSVVFRKKWKQKILEIPLHRLNFEKSRIQIANSYLHLFQSFIFSYNLWIHSYHFLLQLIKSSL